MIVRNDMDKSNSPLHIQFFLKFSNLAASLYFSINIIRLTLFLAQTYQIFFSSIFQNRIHFDLT